MKASIYRARHGRFDLYLNGRFTGQFLNYFEAVDYAKERGYTLEGLIV